MSKDGSQTDLRHTRPNRMGRKHNRVGGSECRAAWGTPGGRPRGRMGGQGTSGDRPGEWTEARLWGAGDRSQGAGLWDADGRSRGVGCRTPRLRARLLGSSGCLRNCIIIDSFDFSPSSSSDCFTKHGIQPHPYGTDLSFPYAALVRSC